MTVTPWEEARLRALSVLWEATAVGGPRFDKDGEVISAEEAGFDAALAALSKHGYAIVPAEATEEMVHAASIAAATAEPPWIPKMINAATEAGDVLRVKP